MPFEQPNKIPPGLEAPDFIRSYGTAEQAAEKLDISRDSDPQGLKAPTCFQRLAARLKACPDKKTDFFHSL
jgi:hypothetical protein